MKNSEPTKCGTHRKVANGGNNSHLNMQLLPNMFADVRSDEDVAVMIVFLLEFESRQIALPQMGKQANMS